MPSCRPDDFRGLGSYWPTHPGVTGCRTVNHVEVHAYVYFTCKMGWMELKKQHGSADPFFSHIDLITM